MKISCKICSIDIHESCQLLLLTGERVRFAQVWHGNCVSNGRNLSGNGYRADMSTTSGGGDMQQQPDNSVTTVYNGDRTVTGQRVSPPSSSNGDSGFDNSNNESTAGDAKLIIDVPDFSKSAYLSVC